MVFGRVQGEGDLAQPAPLGELSPSDTVVLRTDT
jgi:hypothetical protein